MGIPEGIVLTVVETRRIAATTAMRMGVQFDASLIETIDDVIADVLLEAALGPAKPTNEQST